MLAPRNKTPAKMYQVAGFARLDRREICIDTVSSPAMNVARIDLRSSVPVEVLEVVSQLALHGGAWLVGGTVRDLLRGEQPRDFDIATDLTPHAVARAVPAADLSFARFGTCRVATAVGEVSVTTLRREQGYQDHRRPDEVHFVTDLAIDAVRRDFTCNALYFDVAKGEILDPTGGVADLRLGILRCIGTPAVRFHEDALRLLRAMRFAARLGLALSPETLSAAIAAAHELQRLSPERVLNELTQAFTGQGRGRALALLVEWGFAAVLLPEVAAMRGVTQPPQYHPEGDVLTHVCLVLDHVPADDPVLAWSAVLHDVGKPPTWRQAEDRIRFDGHDTLSATMAETILRRLHAPNELREVTAEICRDHIRFAAFPNMRPRRRERWMRTPTFPRHLAFHRADCLGSHGKLEIHELASRLLRELPPVPTPLVVGKDVLALGVAPGPMVGELLLAVQDAADEAAMPMDRDGALVLLRDMVQGLRQAGRLPAR
jgi:putative nucleotidyltransferase with HDIG domain